ncbi:MAG TPA: transporter [Planctomycetota bacterium]|nr:transporter [Planctomycetota bacterium]
MTITSLRRLPLAAATTLLLPGLAAAQGETGFLRGAGHLDTAISYTKDAYNKFWLGTDKVHDPGVGRVTRSTYNLYVAYGLTDEVDLAMSAPWVVASSTSGNFDRESDFQDLGLQAKWRLLRQRVGPGEASLLVAPGIKIPLGHYESDSVTAIGDGQTDYRGRVVAHYGLDNGVFFSLESGYDRRAGLPKDETPWNVTVGATFFDRVTVTPFFSAVRSYGGQNIGQDPFPAVQEEYDRWGVGAYARLTDNFGLTGFWRTTTDGRNTGDVDGYGVGIVFKY